MTNTTIKSAGNSKVDSEQTKIEQRRLANRNTVRKFRFREKVLLEELRRSVDGLTKKNATLRHDNKVCKSAISYIKNMLSVTTNNDTGAVRSVLPFASVSSTIVEPKISHGEAFKQQERCLPPLFSTPVASMLAQKHQQEQLIALLLQRQQQQQQQQQPRMAKPAGVCVADLLKLRQQQPQVNSNQTENMSALMNTIVQQRQQQLLQSYVQQSKVGELQKQQQQGQPNLASIQALLNLM